MQKKYKVIILVFLLLVLVLIFPTYTHYLSGDILGGKILHHPFLAVKPLCSLVGGTFKSEVSGWSNDKTIDYCLVNKKLICVLWGGRILVDHLPVFGGDKKVEIPLGEVRPLRSCIKD